MELTEQLKKQIEDAFHYRGHVTVTLRNGQCVEGFLFNRQYAVPKKTKVRFEGYFVELFLKGGGEKVRLAMRDLESIALTGPDEALGKSYQDWMEKQAQKAKAVA